MFSLDFRYPPKTRLIPQTSIGYTRRPHDGTRRTCKHLLRRKTADYHLPACPQIEELDRLAVRFWARQHTVCYSTVQRAPNINLLLAHHRRNFCSQPILRKKSDQSNPQKRHLPLASGELSPEHSSILIISLFSAGLLITAAVDSTLLLLFVCYVRSRNILFCTSLAFEKETSRGPLCRGDWLCTSALLHRAANIPPTNTGVFAAVCRQAIPRCTLVCRFRYFSSKSQVTSFKP